MTRGGPHERLYDSVSSFLGKKTLPKIPKKWEKFSDIAILPSGSFEGEDWDDLISPALWKAVAEGLDVERLGIMGEVTGKTRKSGARMLRAMGRELFTPLPRLFTPLRCEQTRCTSCAQLRTLQHSHEQALGPGVGHSGRGPDDAEVDFSLAEQHARARRRQRGRCFLRVSRLPGQHPSGSALGAGEVQQCRVDA